MKRLRDIAMMIGTTVLLTGGVALSIGVGVASATSAPSATTEAATSIKPTTAVLNGAVNPHGEATTWYFEYGTSTSATFSSSTVAKSAGAGTSAVSVSYTLRGLASATSYRFRLIATSSTGTVIGDTASFDTAAAPVVLTGAASQVTVSGATLNGIVNPEAHTTSWYFDYGTTTSFGAKTPTTELAESPNNINVSAAISALSPGTTYYFRLVAKNSEGTSIGADLTVTTGRSVTMNVSSSTAVYGQFITLTGSVATGAAGVRVTLLSERFDATAFTGIADVTTVAGGKWSYRTQPTLRTTYEAQANGGTSSPAVLSVRPVVYLTLASGGRLSTRVIGATSFAKHVLQLQRLSHGLWVTWKSVRLNSQAKATFSTSLPKGKTTIRMAIGPFIPGVNQAGPGYLAGYSRSVVYNRK